MKPPPAFLFVVLLSLAATVRPGTQVRVPVPAAVEDAVAGGRRVSVIVGVDSAFVPEGFLDRAARGRQRASIALMAGDVMARAAAAGVAVGRRLDVLPFFTARVDRAALAALAALPGVRSIELDAPERAHLATSVPLTRAPAAWAAGLTGAGWRVAVIDTGVDGTHPFLAGKVVSEACYSNRGGGGGGTSACPGGAASSTAAGSAVPCSVVDDCEHGTHVAGIAAGANAPDGSHGVARDARLIALQVFTRFDDAAMCGSPPCALSYPSDQVLALQHVAALAGPGNTGMIAAVNMSLGGGQYFNQASCDAANESRKLAIDNLRSLGIAVVASSGNNAFATSMSAPACISSVVSVGAVTDALAVSSFSNNAPTLSLYAPGSHVVSSIPGLAYDAFSGTSMAAPHVAGAWAILKQAVPGASVAEVLNALQSTGAMVADLRAASPLRSAHRFIDVDAARQLLQASASGAPGAPSNFVPRAEGNTLTASWTAPALGEAPDGYTLVARLAPNGPVAGTVPLGLTTSLAIPAPNGTFYLSVVAVNAWGPGPESTIVPVTLPALPAPPGSPSGLTVTVTGTTAAFSWNAPAAGGPVAEYVLAAGFTPNFTTAAVSLPLPPAPTSVTIGGIPPGVYYVRLFARNAGGNSAFSTNEVEVVVDAIAPPGSPTGLTVTVSGATAAFRWNAPATGGPVTEYVLAAGLTPGFTTAAVSLALPAAPTSVTIGGIPPGRYYVRVFARNAAGASLFSTNEVEVEVSPP